VRRYYYRLLLLAFLVAPLLWAAACSAGPRTVTIDPVLVRGPAHAPVTIVEFADYQ